MNERGMGAPRARGRGRDIDTCAPIECEAGRSEVAA